MKDLVGITLGQYEIIEKIGQGGMAHVFKAYQRSLDRYVAVKVLSPALADDSGFTERFQREAHSVARLHHPNILQVYDFGIEGPYNYIVMRYVENSRTLGDLLRDQTSLDALIDYIAQVADALNYAHQQGIIHRDVKPSNILIDKRWALLGDFGLVKVTQSSSHLTGTGVGMGTPAYMSPEQASGAKVDHRTDIYALGIILHKILTGTVPHDAPTPLAILIKRSTEPITPLRELKPDVPESLEHVVLRSLSREPDSRYSTATDFAEALKKAKTDPGYREVTVPELTDATVVSSAGPPIRSKKQNFAFIIGGGVVAILILGGLILFLTGVLGPGQATPQSTVPAETVMDNQSAVVVAATDTPAPPTTTPTPIPPGTPSAIAKSDLEIRTGPGDVYDLMGFLPAGAEAEIISRDETNEWWQIKTSLAGASVGWIRAGEDYSEAADTTNVPIALAPSTPTPTPPPAPVPDTPTPTEMPAPATPTPTVTSTRQAPQTTPTRSSQPASTRAPTAVSGKLTILSPNSLDEPTFGLTEFQWQWGGSLPEDQGFEVRVWREGEPPAGVHNAVLDNQQGKVVAQGNNTYRLIADISDAPSVGGRSGDYLWTVLLVQISPEYRELGVQATPPGRLRYAAPGGGDGGGGDGGGGGGLSGGN